MAWTPLDAELFVLLDRSGVVLEVSEASLASLGVPRDEVIGQPFWAAPWWRELTSTQERLRRELSRAGDGAVVRLEVPCRWSWVVTDPLAAELSLLPLRSPSGAVAQIVVEGRDCADRKRLEAELAREREEVALLRSRVAALEGGGPAAAEEARAPSEALDAPDRRPERGGVSGAAERPVVLSVEDDPGVARFLAHVLRRRFRVVSAEDGQAGLEKAMEVRPDLILSDLVMPRMGGEQMVQEIRRRPELSGIPVILLTAWADEDVRIRMLSQGALDYVTKPFSAQELLSRVENLIGLKRARETLQRELQTRNKDLETLASEVVVRKRELQAALEAVRIERDHAEAASRAKSDFLGLVTHELMTPVTVVQLMGQRMLRDRDRPLAPEHAALVARVVRSARRLAGVVQSILEHARVEAGRLALSVESVDLAALARDVLDDAGQEAREKGLEARLVVEPGLEPVSTDRRVLRLVLSNLVSNAVKFTETGSVEVTVGGSGGKRRLIVQDSGPGIPARERTRIFAPFDHLEPLSHKHVPGIGLGLALAKELAVALGGTLELAPGEGPGSTFVLEIPDGPAVERPPAEPDHPPQRESTDDVREAEAADLR